MNKDKWHEKEDFPGLAELAPLLTPQSILRISEDVYRDRVQPLFFYPSPEELWKWKIDALCYMRNNSPESYRTLLIQLSIRVQTSVRKKKLMYF